VKAWTRDAIVAAFQRYAAETGAPPLCEEWQKADRPDYAPSSGPVFRLFGSWNEAMQAAGFPLRASIEPGTVYGRLTVLSRAKSVGSSGRWLCRCECGNETTVYTSSLENGKTKSCGCLLQEWASPIEPGMIFGRLTVVRSLGQKWWICQCECGNEARVKSCYFRKGKGTRGTSSCGCLARETAKELLSARHLDEGHGVKPGEVYGRLTVLRHSGTPRYWICRCVCGTEKSIKVCSLRNGKTKSCGCLARDWGRELASRPRDSRGRLLPDAPARPGQIRGRFQVRPPSREAPA
jgi:hypothetical protein